MLSAAAPPTARAASRGQSAQGGVHVGTGAQGSGGGALISAVLWAPQAADPTLAFTSTRADRQESTRCDNSSPCGLGIFSPLRGDKGRQHKGARDRQSPRRRGPAPGGPAMATPRLRKDATASDAHVQTCTDAHTPPELQAERTLRKCKQSAPLLGTPDFHPSNQDSTASCWKSPQRLCARATHPFGNTAEATCVPSKFLTATFKQSKETGKIGNTFCLVQHT